MTFKALVESRRSAIKFIEGVSISESELTEIFNTAKLYPSCFNLQHAHYVVVTKDEEKEKLKELAWNQHKITQASAVIVVFGDKEVHKKAPDMFSAMKMLRMMDELEYNQTIETINALYEGGGESFQRDEAIRNASLSAMTFMLSAKDAGWDTCPMIGFNGEGIREYLGVAENYVPTLIITIGKSDESKLRARGYRKPVREFVTFR